MLVTFSTRIPFLLVAVFLLASRANADTDTSTAVFNPKFRTIRLTRPTDPLAQPVISLNDNDRLILSFDEIGDDFSDDLQYSLLHCNADWQPSRLLESEFLDGFNFTDIEDYAFSSNTYIHYVNYRVEVPSPQMKILVSGNYLLRVFHRDNPDEILFQIRFRVSEQSASIAAHASGRTDRGINTLWQQLAFTVNSSPSVVKNPLSDLIVTVTQNSRPESTRVIPRPLRFNGNSLIYESLPDLIFNAGNEYRRFETVRTNYPGLGLDSVRYVGPNYHAWISPSLPRAGKEYLFDITQHGRFVVDEYNSTDPDLGADYVTVHFSLDYPEIIDGDIYLEGDLNYRRYDDANRMTYNRQTGLYELEMTLKQGSYNYMYVVKGRESDCRIDSSLIDGDFADTSNEYTVDVFLRTPASRGDRLLGSATFFSNP